MATKNLRVVAYLPQQYHQHLRNYMHEQALTESSAIVKIIKQFFEGQTHSPSNPPDNEAIESLRVQMLSLEQRFNVLEATVEAGLTRKRNATSKTFNQAPPQLPPQKRDSLARRLGVNPASIEEALEKGADYFRDWSKRRDPASRSWSLKGDLFYPMSD